MQFMRLAGSASGSSLGINISTSSVTVIELATFENTVSVQAFCRLPIAVSRRKYLGESNRRCECAGACRRASDISCEQPLRSVGARSRVRRQASRSAARVEWRVFAGGDGNRS